MVGKANENGVPREASSSQLWRLNVIGLLEVRDEPGRALWSREAKEILGEAARQGLWQPEPHKPRGTVRAGG
jgi:hypothetical protein